MYNARAGPGTQDTRSVRFRPVSPWSGVCSVYAEREGERIVVGLISGTRCI